MGKVSEANYDFKMRQLDGRGGKTTVVGTISSNIGPIPFLLTISHFHLARMVNKALKNKSKKAQDGPLTVTVD